MKNICNLCMLICLFILIYSVHAQDMSLSDETEECITCHAELHPGIVQSWQDSRHSKVTPLQAMELDKNARRISSKEIKSELAATVVGCYECHSLNTEKHKDAFEHNGFTINVVVSPKDCETCHETEVNQYSKNIMAHAFKNIIVMKPPNDATTVPKHKRSNHR